MQHSPSQQAEGSGLTPLLKVQGVSVRFGGIVALDDISFNVEAGQICGLIGPNGAGKSTLFNCLSRIYECGAGSIEMNGQALSALRRSEMAGVGIGRTFQNLALFKTMTVLENILLGTHSQYRCGFFKSMLRFPVVAENEAAAQAEARGLIRLLNLDAVADRVVSDLPFGTQKRVELGRALAARPKLLLLDEPACGLNHEELEALSELIVDIRNALGITILLVEHHMSLVMKVSDKVVVLNFGRKIAEGTPFEIRNDAAVIEAYLGSEHAKSA